jgi:hypothetical protein
MKQLELLSEHYNFTNRQKERIEDLIKDIAIGFAEWSQYNCFRHEGDWVYDKILYTSEQLFNEYLNTLK